VDSAEIIKGNLLHLKNSGLSKKWAKKIGCLYDRSSKGIKRLELSDYKEKSKKVNTIISLNNCVKIYKEQVQDGKKMLHVVKITLAEDKNPVLVFGWDKLDERDLWFNNLSLVMFGQNDNFDDNSNQAIFDVEIKSTDLSEKLKLRGTYKLSITTENIELLNSKTYELVIKWPLHFLRKYGRDKQLFSLEAGRRCRSGHGMFYFKTDQYNAIFQDVEKNVKALACRNRTLSTTNSIQPSSSLALHLNKPNSPPFRKIQVPSPPESPRVPFPALPKTPISQSTCVYDNPLDAKADKKKQQVSQSLFPQNSDDVYSYDEPMTCHKSPNLKKAKKKGYSNKNVKSPVRPSPPCSDTYSVAEDLPQVADVVGDYSRLDISGFRKSSIQSENEYDSLAWNNKSSSNLSNFQDRLLLGNAQYATAYDFHNDDNEYAIAEDLSLNIREDSTYDHVQR